MLPTWGRATEAILRHGGLTQATLARETGVSRVVLNRYLRGRRVPQPATVLKINGATARLLKIKDVERYLNAIAAYHDYLDISTDEAKLTAMLGAARGLRVLDEYMSAAARRAMFDEITALPEPKMTQLLVALFASCGKRVMRHLDGSVPTTTELEETIAICEQFELDVRSRLRPEEQLRVLRSRDAFALALGKALAEATTDFALRKRLERQVLAAFQKYVFTDTEETLRIPYNEISEE